MKGLLSGGHPNYTAAVMRYNAGLYCQIVIQVTEMRRKICDVCME